MRTSDFITKQFGLIPAKKKWCASVFQDVDGNFYSYGYHYPLLFKIEGKWFVNTHGYSNTTSKHIGYAQGLADYTVQLKNSTRSYGYGYNAEKPTLENIITSLVEEKHELSKIHGRGYAQEHRNGRIEQITNTLEAITPDRSEVNELILTGVK